MTDLLLRLTSETGRRWLYNIGIAAGAIAVGYGILTAEMAALWLGLLAALLGGVAVLHVGEAGVDVPAGGDWIDSQADDGYPDLLDDPDGKEAKVYYAKAMREAGEILKAGRSGYYSTQRRIGFSRPEGKRQPAPSSHRPHADFYDN